MKSTLLSSALFFCFSCFALTTGEKAPDFKLPGINKNGEIVSLSDFNGKTVVLEWLNHGCPFVRKHYDSGNMQKLQKNSSAQNVIWLSIISSAPGKQGHVNRQGAMDEKKKYKSAAANILLDTDGKVGRQYEAKTTPHMYIINKEGILIYQGAIDDKPDTAQSSIAGARNYVTEALAAINTGKKVSIPKTQAYGCSVKY